MNDDNAPDLSELVSRFQQMSELNRETTKKIVSELKIVRENAQTVSKLLTRLAKRLRRAEDSGVRCNNEERVLAASLMITTYEAVRVELLQGTADVLDELGDALDRAARGE